MTTALSEESLHHISFRPRGLQAFFSVSFRPRDAGIFHQFHFAHCDIAEDTQESHVISVDSFVVSVKQRLEEEDI